MSTDLNTRLLSTVSRSFYLSLRFLPKEFRLPLSTAYLLARATDTVADTAKASGEERIGILENISSLLTEKKQTGTEKTFLIALREKLAPNQAHPGEKELLSRFDEVLAAYRSLPESHIRLIREVMEKIIRGQLLDLRRFDCASPSGVIPGPDGIPSLPDHENLLEYTYLVAGCVGEFWTKLGFEIYNNRYATEDREQMLLWGKHYGQGLQLVNILRDRDEDAARGRSYLPPDVAPETCLRLAKEYLKEGIRYTEALTGRRLRFATGLPALIGLETLSLLAPTSASGTKVKVPRKKIYLLIWQALLASRRQGAWTDIAQM